ncbi:helix-turn-helix domain-containing protein, partial [Bifidobacterium longum]|uniref:helix-turn-helix domain-containing protein n=1 Tax=Bifidobacterium longum TaxID=216816 RepID=UPI001E2FE3C3
MKAYSHLSAEERIRIDELRNRDGLGVRQIALRIGRDKATVSRELKRGLWFASNENDSYRPYRPKRLKTGPWTCRCISSSRCFVFSHVFFSGLGSCMHFP